MNIQELSSKSAEASRLLKQLANPYRLRILCELHRGERSVTELGLTVDLSQSALSQHLAKLRAAGVVATRRDAQTIHYSIADPKTGRLLAVMYELFCGPGATQSKKQK